MVSEVPGQEQVGTLVATQITDRETLVATRVARSSQSMGFAPLPSMRGRELSLIERRPMMPSLSAYPRLKHVELPSYASNEMCQGRGWVYWWRQVDG